jgi:hypothetical protein
MPDWLVPLLPYIIEYAAVPLLVAFVTWLVSVAPGPIKTALQAIVFNKDMAHLVALLGRGAVGAYALYTKGQISNGAEAINYIIGYAQRSAPGLMSKLKPGEEQITNLATEAWEKWLLTKKPALVAVDTSKPEA